MEGDYQPGQEAFYHETGVIYQVEVLENNSDKEWEKYSLRVKRIVDSGIFEPFEIGEIFECEKRRGPYISGLWQISDHN